MRLLAHNLLMCNRKNCDKNNYPLTISVSKSQIIECEFKKDALLKLITKLDWAALHKTVVLLGNKDFPLEAGDKLDDEKFLRELHTIILETHILEGYLMCENCQRKYPIVNGIPNMILTDSEV